MFPDLKLV